MDKDDKEFENEIIAKENSIDLDREYDAVFIGLKHMIEKRKEEIKVLESLYNAKI